jgi:hypothetical protein
VTIPTEAEAARERRFSTYAIVHGRELMLVSLRDAAHWPLIASGAVETRVVCDPSGWVHQYLRPEEPTRPGGAQQQAKA